MTKDHLGLKRLIVCLSLVLVCCGSCFGLCACDDDSSPNSSGNQALESTQAQSSESSQTQAAESGAKSSDATTKATAATAASEAKSKAESAAKSSSSTSGPKGSSHAKSDKSASSSSYVAHEWSYAKYPLYYKVWGKARVSEKLDRGDVDTTGRDSKERAGRVVSKVTYGMVEASAGWREGMDSDCDDISGWGHQAKVSVGLSNGRTYNGYAWNRSHLLADSLGGHADPDNLVTGTRTQNVGNNTQSNPGGMQYTETMALEYLRSHHKGWVYYAATPVFKGSELVCRSVYVDIKSDDGSIDEHVEIFNAMRGCTINYKTGEISGSSVSAAKKKSGTSNYSSGRAGSSASSSSGAHSASSSSSHSSSGSSSSSKNSNMTVYVTNSGTKYHAKGCRYLKSQRAMSLSKAKSLGYEPCKVCMG